MLRRFPTIILLTGLVLLANLTDSQSPTSLAADPSPAIAADRRPPYVLDSNSFAAALRAAPDEAARRAVFSERWRVVQRAVAHSSVVGGRTGFHVSMRYWSGDGRWPKDVETIPGDLTKPIVRSPKVPEKVDAPNAGKEEEGAAPADTPPTPAATDKPAPADRQPAGVRRGGFPPAFGRAGTTFPEQGLIIIQGDCLENVELDWGSLHVYGDVAARITLKGQAEVIVGGSINPKGEVVTDGIVRVFVGGDVEGSIHNAGSCELWLNGDHRGELTTGWPSADVRIMGHCTGTIKPSKETRGGGMLRLEVGGFASAKAIEAIGALPYTSFQASLGSSDQDPGIYPSPASMPFVPENGGRIMRAGTGGWVVHRRAESEKGN